MEGREKIKNGVYLADRMKKEKRELKVIGAEMEGKEKVWRVE